MKLLMMQSRADTCEYDQPMTVLRVPDLAASQQHFVQVQWVVLPLPQHRPCKLVQAVVRLLTLDHRFKETKGHEGFNIKINLWAA